MNVYGELTRAQLENFASAGAEPSVSSAVPGRMWWRSDIKKTMVDSGIGKYSPDPVFNVQAFGALGDGSTDDAAAINLAIAAACNLRGGTVFVPTSRNAYYIGSNLSIGGAIRFIGEAPGEGSELRYDGTGTAGPMITITANANGTEICNLSFDQSSRGNATDAILVKGVDSTIHDCFAPCRYPFSNSIVNTNRADGYTYHLTVYNCTFNQAPASFSKTGRTNTNTTLDNLSTVTGLKNGMFVAGTGIPAGTTISALGASSCTLSQAATASASGVALTFWAPCTPYGVIISGGHTETVNACMFFGFGTAAILIEVAGDGVSGNALGPTISNSYIASQPANSPQQPGTPTAVGIKVNGCQGIAITGCNFQMNSDTNAIAGSAMRDIVFNNVKGGSVTGCQFYRLGETGSASISINGSASSIGGLVIHGNNFNDVETGIEVLDSTAKFWVGLNSRTGAGTRILTAGDFSSWEPLAVTDPHWFSAPIRLGGSTSGYVGHKAAATTTSHTLTWPSAQGAAGTSLQNDGSGGLSWAISAGAGGNLLLNSGLDYWQRGTTGTIASGAGTAATAGLGTFAGGAYTADRIVVLNNIGGDTVLTWTQTTAANVGSGFGHQVVITTQTTGSVTTAVCETNYSWDSVSSQALVGKSLSFSAYIKPVQRVTVITAQFLWSPTEQRNNNSAAVHAGASTTFTLQAGVWNLVTWNAGWTVPAGVSPSGCIGLSLWASNVSSGNLIDAGNGFILEQLQLNIGGAPATWGRMFTSRAIEQNACLKYHWQTAPTAASTWLCNAYFDTTTSVFGVINFPQQMHKIPICGVDAGANLLISRVGTTAAAGSGTPTYANTAPHSTQMNATSASASTAGFGTNIKTTGYFYANAEL